MVSESEWFWVVLSDPEVAIRLSGSCPMVSSVLLEWDDS